MFRFRAGRALVVGVAAMVGVALIVSRAGVLGGLLAGTPAALLAPRAQRLRLPLSASVAGAVLGALVASLAFGRGGLALRAASGAVASLAVAPWCFVLAFVLWARVHAPLERR